MSSLLLILLLCVSQILAPLGTDLPARLQEGQGASFHAAAFVDPNGLSALLSSGSPVYGDLPPALREPGIAPETRKALFTLTGALHQLGLTGHLGQEALGLTVGTKDQPLASFTMFTDAETGANSLVSDLTRRVFILPRDQVKHAQDTFGALSKLDIQALVAPYWGLFSAQMDALLAESAPHESIYIYQGKDFNHMGSLRFDTRHLAELALAFHNQLALDQPLREAIKTIFQLASAGSGAASSDPTEELLKDLKESAEGLKAEDARPLFDLDAWRGADGATLYTLDDSALPGRTEWVNAEFLLAPKETAFTLILTDARETAPDWASLRDAASRTQPDPLYPYDFIHGSLQADALPGEAKASLQLTLARQIQPPLSLQFTQLAPQGDGVLSLGQIKLFLQDTAPLLTLNLIAKSEASGPILPDTAGWQESEVNGALELPPAAVSLLPAKLLGRFFWAFPEDGEAGVPNAEQIIDAQETLIGVVTPPGY